MKQLLNVCLRALDDVLQQRIASDNGSGLVGDRITRNDDPDYVHIHPRQCCCLQTRTFDKDTPDEACKLTKSWTCFSAVFVILNSCPSISGLDSANSTSIFCWNSSISSSERASRSTLYIPDAWADHKPSPETNPSIKPDTQDKRKLTYWLGDCNSADASTSAICPTRMVHEKGKH